VEPEEKVSHPNMDPELKPKIKNIQK